MAHQDMSQDIGFNFNCIDMISEEAVDSATVQVLGTENGAASRSLITLDVRDVLECLGEVDILADLLSGGDENKGFADLASQGAHDVHEETAIYTHQADAGGTLSCEPTENPSVEAQIDVDKEQFLWDKGVLGCSDGFQIMNSLLFKFAEHFSILGGTELRSLRFGPKSQFSKHYDCQRKKFYLEYKVFPDSEDKKPATEQDLAQCTKLRRAYEDTNMPERCIITLYENYLKLRPTVPHNAFFLRPSRKANGDAWFTNSAVGRHKLVEYLRNVDKVWIDHLASIQPMPLNRRSEKVNDNAQVASSDSYPRRDVGRKRKRPANAETPCVRVILHNNDALQFSSSSKRVKVHPASDTDGSSHPDEKNCRSFSFNVTILLQQ